MKEELSQEQNRGKKTKHWYTKNPKRLKKEKELLKNRGFDFKLLDGLTTWVGEITTANPDGYKPVHYKSIEVQIICPADFPEAFPRVRDINGVLENKPHVEPHNFLCYAFPPESDLDFSKENDLEDLINVLEEYLLKQDLFLVNGKWPDEARHGLVAFIEYEYFNGRLDPKAICPCRSTKETYEFCHLNMVKNQIARINKKLRWEYGRRRLGRNQKCPCPRGIKQGLKYKKCCLHKEIFGKGHEVITLYKELTPDRLKHELDLLDSQFLEKS